jgi:hypothetical protein
MFILKDITSRCVVDRYYILRRSVATVAAEGSTHCRDALADSDVTWNIGACMRSDGVPVVQKQHAAADEGRCR